MSTLSDEAERLAGLRALHILDTPPDDQFDAVCRTAQRLFGVETAFIAFLDDDRQWLKTPCAAVPTELPRAQSFCRYTVESDDILVVPDARLDPRFQHNALVTRPSGLVFYAGAPLVPQPGIRVGTLCVIDSAARAFSAADEAALRDLAGIVVAQLRLHQANRLRALEVEARIAHERLIEAQAEEIREREAAQASANRLLTMAEQLAHVGHWRVELAGGQPTWSEGLYEIAGYDPAALPPHMSVFMELYHPADRDRVVAVVAEAIASGEDFDFEARIVRPDAAIRDVLVRGTCEADASGTTATLFGILIDVTEQRQAEVEIRHSETRYRGLADALPLLVWAMRPSDGEATYLNASFRDYFGPIGTGRPARLSANHPDDAPAMARAWEQALATGSGYCGQWRLRRRDGTYRWHKFSMTPVYQEAGEATLVEWLGTALDIDDLVTGRIAVEEAQNLLRIALEAADAGTWDWDMRSGVTTQSSESARIFGLPDLGRPAVMTTAEWTALVNPDDAPLVWEAVQRAIDTRSTYAAEFRVGERWVYARGRTLYGEDGRPRRMVGLHLDVSERKAAEAALRALHTEAQEARAEAERASEAKSDFLAAMSHEIRTPLNSILGYADLLLDRTVLGEEERRRLELIQGSGAALLTVVNDILDFSKIEAGQLALDTTQFPLLAIIDSTVSIVRGGALKSGLRIDARIDPSLPPFVVGDASRLRQVLLNLLNNAVKFTPRGSVTLNARRCGGGPDGEVIRFEVTDTGIGVSAEQQTRLFKRFSQVDSSISRRFGGTGLGLAICRHLVTLMGGEIGVESREGAGSTFWFTLTLPRGAAPLPVPETIPAGIEEDAADGSGIRLLLVEDVPVNQELACAVLETRGYHVDVAGDGAEAVAAVLRTAAAGMPYALVLMDVQMPGMDGLTATRLIRDLPEPACRVPIVAMTANVLPQQVEALHEAGMDDHVGKPFRRADLFATIARWTARQPEPEPVGDERGDAAHDANALSAIRQTLGAARVQGLLALLVSELEERFRPGETDRSQIAHDAHAMVSAAAMLGFVGLSDLCREIEAAAHGGADLGPLIERLHVLRAGTLGTIRTLQAA